MILDHSFPREANYSKEKNIPLVIVGGTVEYHGPHCSYGCDTLIAEGLIKRLFELECPEIYDGIVEIKSISRAPGSRSKIAVISNDPNVDAVGTCIGPQKSRITAVTNEIKGEKIDVVLYSEDPEEFIKQALKPAEVTQVVINDPAVRAYCGLS